MAYKSIVVDTWVEGYVYYHGYYPGYTTQCSHVFILKALWFCISSKSKTNILVERLWGHKWHTIWSVVAEQSRALESSSGVVRMWVRIPAWPVAALVSLWARHFYNHNCLVLRLGRKAVGLVCCVMHVKEPRTFIVKEKGLVPVFMDSRLEHQQGGYVRAANLLYYHY